MMKRVTWFVGGAAVGLADLPNDAVAIVVAAVETGGASSLAVGMGEAPLPSDVVVGTGGVATPLGGDASPSPTAPSSPAVSVEITEPSAPSIHSGIFSPDRLLSASPMLLITMTSPQLAVEIIKVDKIIHRSRIMHLTNFISFSFPRSEYAMNQSAFGPSL